MTKHLSASNHQLKILLWCLHLLILGSAVYLYPVNWDEGWTFCSARHLLESHHYGCKYNGNFTPTRLTTSLSTVLMASAGFALFGVSYIGGRILFAAQAVLLLFVLSHIVRKAWGERVELVFLACMLGLSSDPRIHPMVLGAQAWGEVPALLGLCIGILLIQRQSLERGYFWNVSKLLLPVPFLIFAVCTKVQFRPFIAAAFLSSSTFLALYRRTRREASIFLTLGLIAWLLPPYLPPISMPQRHPLDMTGMIDVGMDIVRRLAIVIDPEVRLRVLSWTSTTHGIVVFLLLLSLFVKRPDAKSPWRFENAPIVPILAFSVVVLGWFLTLSIDFPRYLAPALICAAAPVALAATISFSKASSKPLLGYSLPLRMPERLRPWILAGCAFVALSNLANLTKTVFSRSTYNSDLYRTATFLNSHAKNGAVVETYDSSLYHLLNVPYVYPSDDYHLLTENEQATARRLWGKRSSRYLIMGDWSRMFQIAVGVPDGYSELARFGEFVIFERQGE